jgi:pimeloyl-ACP methyl ester carboxylesterase
LRGSKSDYILDEDFDTILHHFPKAKIHTISEAGHWLHAENPSAFYYEIKQFVG